MSQKETNVWRSILLESQKLGYRLFRNQRYKGPIVHNGKITGAWADCGVGGDGGSDLIGYRIVTITPDMVGKKFAQFSVVETKITGGDIRKKQVMFIDAINKNGGIGIFAYSMDDLNGVS